MIYLLRHGQFSEEYAKCYIGQKDIPLSRIGRQQAQYWKTELKDIPFNGVFCSDLDRTMETAGIILNTREDIIAMLPALREIHLGDWEGLAMQEIMENDPKAWQERGEQFASFRPPNGENFQDLYNRVIPVFLKIVENMKGNILIVAHAGVNRMILCYLLNKPIQELFSIPQDEGALNLIDRVDHNLVIKKMNMVPDFGPDQG